MLSVSILLVLATSGILFFVHNEGWTMSEALYWTVGTMMVRKLAFVFNMIFVFVLLSIHFLPFLLCSDSVLPFLRLSGTEIWQ